MRLSRDPQPRSQAHCPMKITPRSRLLYLSAIILSGLLLGYVQRLIFPFYVVLFTSFFLSAFLFARSIKRFGWIVHNFSFVFLALAITELYFEFEQTDDRAAFPQLMASQDSLGYAAR